MSAASDRREAPARIEILTTGGTIDKTYNEADGTLANVGSVLHNILCGLRHYQLLVHQNSVMSKDSREMDGGDRELILTAVSESLPHNDAVIVIHGTDTLTETGEHLHTHLRDLDRPVILTGAMRPFEFRDTDAVQNVTEALLCSRLLAPGVWVVMHSMTLKFPGIVKDRTRNTFVRSR